MGDDEEEERGRTERLGRLLRTQAREVPGDLPIEVWASRVVAAVGGGGAGRSHVEEAVRLNDAARCDGSRVGGWRSSQCSC